MTWLQLTDATIEEDNDGGGEEEEDVGATEEEDGGEEEDEENKEVDEDGESLGRRKKRGLFGMIRIWYDKTMIYWETLKTLQQI